MKRILHLVFFLFPVCSFCQLIIGGTNPIDFVNQTLSSNNVFVSNYLYQGYNGAICYFAANTPNMPFTSGILMTTGNVTNAPGPNNSTNTSMGNGFGGYSPLSNLVATSTYDAAVLSFDATPFGDTLSIEYIFASEEYPEYVGSQFTDITGIFISGPGIPGNPNIARLPNGDLIGVNYINNGNPGGTNGSGPSPAVNPGYFVNNVTFATNALQYDGMTVPLIAKVAVIPTETYRVTIAIADCGDSNFDSGLFIKEGGITASLKENGLENQVAIWYDSENQQAIIHLTDVKENLVYSVSDVSGKTLENGKLPANMQIDLSAYSSGMYLIRVAGKHGVISKKIVR